jgi:SAM-dependent methyltransferase
VKKFNYESKEYLHKLDELPDSYYSKYIEYLQKYLSKDSIFLDVGCGNGEVLKILQRKGFTKGYGIDISKLFVHEAKKKGLKNIYSYDGNKFPFDSNKFDLVGSFNVLEHTNNPGKFIGDQVKLIKKNGYILIACPNFLSSTLQSPHPRIKGVKNRIRNLHKVYKKLISLDSNFESMPMIKRKPFQYDDDATVLTNLIDIKRLLNKYGCSVIYESGFINYNTGIYKIINSIPLVRYSLPSCFIVAKKK